mgnify:CR=1 FL=1
MSSHHFVKEDQEPALLLADATAISFSVIQELMEWSPTIIVLESTLSTVLTWGIKIDVVIDRQESGNQLLDVLKDQAPVKILSHSDQDDPLQTAFYFLTAGKYQAVNVVGVDLRTLEPFSSQLDVVTFNQGKRWLHARNGKFEKWVSQGTKFDFPEYVKPIGGLDENGYASSDGIVKAETAFPFWVGEVLL